ncbi:ABC transporter substrate-binding protein [Clostridium estertheticum]|uniref:ABC transporter substrate-binding protein n=1 Tax=Clostridium estertheticum TaxID=238834 RepID=UPI0013E91BAA|nr:ABC transporter substrate-binding protein [Clostridium estertheticum]MBZ9685703.1 ABC transporter substrate-binding protein [Clostridium estertheticum]
MLKTFKKMLSVFAAMAVTMSVVGGCGSKQVNTSTPPPTKEKEVVTLKWVQVGNGMPKNYAAWKDNINKYLGEKIGVNIDVEVVSWGDWDNRRNVLVNSGEKFDVLFTNSNNYLGDISKGAYYDISNLVKTKSADLYKYIPEKYWDAVKVDGKIYSVPTYKDSSMTNYLVWDKNKAVKDNIDYQNINTLQGMDGALRTLKDKEGKASLILNLDGLYSIYAPYDGMSAGLPALGVRYDDNSRKVVSVFEQSDIMSQLELINKWYKDGIVNADAPTLAEVPKYRPAFIAQGWKSAAVTTWGPQMGVDADAVQIGDTVVSNETVRGSLSAISASTKYPEKCLEFLQLVNLDSKVRDAFYYGLEGDNFQYVDGKVKKLNEDWSMAGYTQGTFFNVSQLVDAKLNQWDEVKKLNETAKSSVLIGFNLNTSKIENELANCRQVYSKYKSELLTGAKEPKAEVAAMVKELNAAGFDKIVKEAQSQVDAFNK